MNNKLIVFYSLFGNTESLASEIAIQTNGTLRKLVPYKNYSFDYNTAAKEVRNQIFRGFCPELISGNESIEDYQTIFIGSPNWFKTLAPPVLSFLRTHDFTGKTVIPFCTHGGGGFGQIETDKVGVSLSLIGQIETDITRECSKSIILPGNAVSGTVTSEEVTNWLGTIGYEL